MSSDSGSLLWVSVMHLIRFSPPFLNISAGKLSVPGIVVRLCSSFLSLLHCTCSASLLFLPLQWIFVFLIWKWRDSDLNWYSLPYRCGSPLHPFHVSYLSVRKWSIWFLVMPSGEIHVASVLKICAGIKWCSKVYKQSPLALLSSWRLFLPLVWLKICSRLTLLAFMSPNTILNHFLNSTY